MFFYKEWNCSCQLLQLMSAINVYWASISRAMDNYKLRAYFGRIVFFAASELIDPSEILKDTRLDWAKVAKGELETYLIPGDHSTLLKEPNLRILAEKLKACFGSSC